MEVYCWQNLVSVKNPTSFRPESVVELFVDEVDLDVELKKWLITSSKLSIKLIKWYLGWLSDWLSWFSIWLLKSGCLSCESGWDEMA